MRLPYCAAFYFIIFLILGWSRPAFGAGTMLLEDLDSVFQTNPVLHQTLLQAFDLWDRAEAPDVILQERLTKIRLGFFTVNRKARPVVTHCELSCNLSRTVGQGIRNSPACALQRSIRNWQNSSARQSSSQFVELSLLPLTVYFSCDEKISLPPANTRSTSSSAERQIRSASAPTVNRPFVSSPIARAGFCVAIATTSCNGTLTCLTIVFTRSIMREALPASAERSASRQTPPSTTQSLPKSENRDPSGNPAPAVASVTRQIPPAPFARYNILINVGET